MSMDLMSFPKPFISFIQQIMNLCRAKSAPLTVHPLSPLRWPSNRISTTKYSVVLFLPLALISQFKRLANLYFLATAVIQSIPTISPLQPFDSIFPLAIVLIVSLIREAVEEYSKYKYDRKVNATECEVWEAGAWVQKKAEQLRVGMLCKIKDGELLSADMLPLRSAKQEGVLYLETSGLDGEKALKNRYVPKFLQQLQMEDYSKLEIQLTEPSASLYKFEAHFSLSSYKERLTLKNFLYRGSKLKNSQQVVALVIFVGKYTKTMLNMGEPQNKMSAIERQVNKYMIAIFLIELVLMTTESLLRYFNVLSEDRTNPFTYSRSPGQEAGMTFAGYFILLNTMIPISLIVSIEVIKSIQGYFINHDELLSKTVPDSQQPIHAQTFRSSLNEQLGMIEYVFTDKTGTLTRNQMVMKQLLIGGELYPNMNQADEFEKQRVFVNQHIEQDRKGNEKLKNTVGRLTHLQQLIEIFLFGMSICHECVLNSDVQSLQAKDIVYEGTSPDEIALVDTARWLGWVYRGPHLNDRLIWHNGEILRFEVLNLFEFDSDRKRMSIIIRTKDGILMFMKGADNIIKKRLDYTQVFLQVVEKRVEEFSIRGLRTLLFCYKYISEEDYQSFYSSVVNLADKDKELKDKLVGEMENGMTLIGATAVEDRLQDHVPETLRDLLLANIKVCMLTGDKLETAENIARSCNLIMPQYSLLQIREANPTSDLENSYLRLKQLKSINEKVSLIIQGSALQAIVSNTLFQGVLEQADSIVCCRVTPKDKASVVAIARRKMNKITLAIGDGANDVEMISEANIGIGLYGNEGMSAVQASDYALPEFKGLWRLLFLHGRWDYMRVTDLIKYFFFKNMVFTLPQFFYSFYCGFSGESIYVGLYLSMFNTIFTSLPVVVRAVLEQDLNYLSDMDDANSEHPSVELSRSSPVYSIPSRLHPEQLLPSVRINTRVKSLMPSLYLVSQKNLLFTHRQFLLVNLEALFCSAIIYFVCQYSEPYEDYFVYSMSVYTCVFFLVTAKLCFQIQYWTWLMMVSIVFFSVVPYVLFNLVDSLIPSQPTYGTFTIIYTDPTFYLVVIGTSSVTVGLSAAADILKVYFWPTRIDRVRKRMIRDLEKSDGGTSSRSSKTAPLIEMAELPH